jgi:hypothetical protein
MQKGSLDHGRGWWYVWRWSRWGCWLDSKHQDQQDTYHMYMQWSLQPETEVSCELLSPTQLQKTNKATGLTLLSHIVRLHHIYLACLLILLSFELRWQKGFNKLQRLRVCRLMRYFWLGQVMLFPWSVSELLIVSPCFPDSPWRACRTS